MQCEFEYTIYTWFRNKEIDNLGDQENSSLVSKAGESRLKSAQTFLNGSKFTICVLPKKKSAVI